MMAKMRETRKDFMVLIVVCERCRRNIVQWSRRGNKMSLIQTEAHRPTLSSFVRRVLSCVTSIEDSEDGWTDMRRKRSTACDWMLDA